MPSPNKLETTKSRRGEVARVPLRVGITGTIGSGKSTASQYLTNLGAIPLSADAIAREQQSSNPIVQQKIKKAFGNVYQGEVLDRGKLARIVFSDPKRLRKLNSIVHPFVFKEVKRRIASISENLIGKQYVLVEAALIYESGMHNDLDIIIVIAAEREKCITRVVKRDRASRAEVVRRIKAQMPLAEKLSLADIVVHNNRTRKALRSKMAFVHTIITQLLE